MSENQLNPVMELKDQLDKALADFNKKTGILIETIELIHKDVSTLGDDRSVWIRDKIEVHFKTGIYR